MHKLCIYNTLDKNLVCSFPRAKNAAYFFSKDIFFQNLIDVTQTFMYIHI